MIVKSRRNTVCQVLCGELHTFRVGVKVELSDDKLAELKSNTDDFEAAFIVEEKESKSEIPR